MTTSTLRVRTMQRSTRHIGRARATSLVRALGVLIAGAVIGNTASCTWDTVNPEVPPGLVPPALSDSIKRCLVDRGIAPACAEAYVSGASMVIKDAEAQIHATSASDEATEVRITHLATLWCGSVVAAIDDVVKHSSDSVPPKEPDETWTAFCTKLGAKTFLPESSQLTFTSAPVDVAAGYPCTEEGETRVLCASPTFSAGVVMSLAMVMDGAIPLASTEYHHQYAFVFDSDADPSNNYQASAAYPNDFFDGTDRWYVASYTPQQGWNIAVSTASGSTITPVPSEARIVIDGETLLLLVPADELASPCPPYRMTAFTHRGDYGLNPPYNWSGDVEPPVGTPLETTCVEIDPAAPSP